MGAVNLPYEELDEVESCISKDRPVVIYCAYGVRAFWQRENFAGRGYDTVNVLGGLYYYRGKYYVT
ncbi:MAG: rhodanese-like domain-containing protein [Roseburia sp.]